MSLLHLKNPSPTKRSRTTITMIPMQTSGGQNFVRRTGSKRPVDKALIAITHVGLAAAQLTTTLVTVTFPCTIVGLRWDITTIATAGTAAPKFHWAIVKVQDGNTVKTLGTGNGGTLYAPEQNVMAFGATVVAPSDQAGSMRYEGSTKTMRKMMGGDVLMFICLGEATNTQEVRGAIQFFCKT